MSKVKKRIDEMNGLICRVEMFVDWSVISEDGGVGILRELTNLENCNFTSNFQLKKIFMTWRIGLFRRSKNK